MLESVEHAREDFTARRLIELKNKADGDCGTPKGPGRGRRRDRGCRASST